MLKRSVFLGPIFEGFVASEIIKHQLHSGKAKVLYYFRDQQGLEVDFLVPLGEARLALLEAKATRTPMPSMGKSLTRLNKSIQRYTTTGYLICQPMPQQAGMRHFNLDMTLVPGTLHGGGHEHDIGVRSKFAIFKKN